VALGRPPVALVWADPVQVIEISSGQIAALDLADFLEERAQAHVLRSHAAASSASVASRHRRRASELAAAVYGSFPRLGHA
jgi:hypothetical protein